MPEAQDGLLLGLGLVQIEAHAHLAVHTRGSSQVLARLIAFAAAPIQLAEAKNGSGR
jgi:hypothetical protein